MFLQQLVRLLDRHLIVAIIKIICRNTRQNITLIWVCFLSLQSAVYRQQHINWIILLLLLLSRQISSDSCLIGSCPEDQYIRCLVLETSALQWTSSRWSLRINVTTETSRNNTAAVSTSIVHNEFYSILIIESLVQEVSFVWYQCCWHDQLYILHFELKNKTWRLVHCVWRTAASQCGVVEPVLVHQYCRQWALKPLSVQNQYVLILLVTEP